MYLYENFNLNNPFISVDLIVWAMFAGFVAAAIMAVYNKRVIGGFVKKLIEKECLSPETAMTIVELEYGTDWFIKNALRTDSVLRRFVVRVGAEAEAEPAEKNDAESGAEKADADEGAKNSADNGAEKPSDKKKRAKKSSAHEDIDFLTAKFYIPEELKYKAEVRYASRGTNLVTLAVTVVVLAAFAFAVRFMIPELMQFIDNYIGTLKK